MSLDTLFNPGSGTPLVVAPGWGVGLAGHQHFIDELASTGQPVLYVESLRRGVPDLRYANPQPYPRCVQLQAEHIEECVRRHGLGEAIGIGLSFGGLKMLAAAHAAPDLFRRIVLLGGAALCDETPLRLIQRGREKRRHDKYLARHHDDPLVRQLSSMAPKGVWRYIRANPLRAFAEGWVISRYQALSLIHELEERGIQVFPINGTDDVLFSPARMQATAAALATGRCMTMTNMPHDMQRFPRRTVDYLRRHGLLD